MCEENKKVRVWFYKNGETINFPAWEFTEAEIKVMKEAGYVLVHGQKYSIKEMVFDTAGEALNFYIEEV